MRSIVLILAGGKGRRMNMAQPKQFAEVMGYTVLQHTMMAFEKHELISAIYVVAAQEWQESVKQQALEAGISKFKGCASAGKTGFDSLMCGILHISDYEKPDTLVMIHDAVRPLISQDTISRNLAVAMAHGNAITCLESQESFMVLDKPEEEINGVPRHASNVISREQIMRAQTPQTFSLKELDDFLNEAHDKGIEEAQSAFMLAQILGHTPLYVSEGEMTNFKITHPQDLVLMQGILAQMQ